MLRIIDRYLLREFLLFLLLGLTTFIGIYTVVDLFEKIDIFVDHKTSLGTILYYYAHKLPLMIAQVLPVAMLLGAILSFGQLRKFNELTAMQSCGLSPVRITRPVLACALLITAGSFIMAERIVPAAYQIQQETMEVKIKGRPARSHGRTEVYYMGRRGRVYVARRYKPNPPALEEVSLQHFRSDGLKQQMWKRLDARRGRFSEEIWHLEDGCARVFGSGSAEIAADFRAYADSRCVEQPDEFDRPKNDPFNMNRKQLRDYIQRIRESGARVQQYETDYHLRFAFPVANLIMVLLGTCLSLRIVRGTLALGFGLSVSLGFAYYGLLRVGQALGYNGQLPPLGAAWLGNLVFLAIGIFLFWKMNR